MKLKGPELERTVKNLATRLIVEKGQTKTPAQWACLIEAAEMMQNKARRDGGPAEIEDALIEDLAQSILDLQERFKKENKGHLGKVVN